MCTCVKCRDCGCVYMYGVPRDCGYVHVWSAQGLWVCRCVECLGIVGVYMYMCGVPRDCGCVHVRCVGCGCVDVWSA